MNADEQGASAGGSAGERTTVFTGLPPVPSLDRERRKAPPPPMGRGMGARRRGWVIAGVVTVALLMIGGVVLALLRLRTGSVGGGKMTATPGGLVYENRAEHVRFTAPVGWVQYPTRSAQVMVRGEGCSFGLLEQRTRLSGASLADAEAKDFAQRHPETDPAVTQRVIAGQDALTFGGRYQDSEGEPMSQTYVLVDRGDTVVTLVETGTAAGCAASFLAIERGLSL